MSTRLALLGGIYSNYRALQAALRDVRTRGVDGVYCLGDLGAFGPFPDRVFPLLRDAGVRCIQGNYDNSLAGGLEDCRCGYTDPRDNYFAGISYRYTNENTSQENKTWMGNLPHQLCLEVEGHQLLLCHGSPRKMNEFVWNTTSPDQFLGHLLQTAEADVVCATHTGIKWRRQITPDQHWINVGVLGRPENDGATNVWYTMLELAPARVHVEFIPVIYDHGSLAEDMREERLPQEFIETILTGWWTTCLEVLPHKERARGKF
jgi:predicted phosphodiesterase